MSNKSLTKWTFLGRFGAITLLAFPVIVLQLTQSANSHGRLIDPPSRSSAWRFGFNTIPNYNDHELYCGGFSRHYVQNKGQCGICGDPFDLDEPRPNEAGGLYGQGLLVRKYFKNSIIKLQVELTANHRGYFEFRLCPNNNPKKIATQKCLDTYLLQQSNGNGSRYYPSEGTKVFESRYLLPRELICSQCVLQWRYIAGNNWGKCEDGREAIGCGPQEEFRACADITIRTHDQSGQEYIPEEDNEIENDGLEMEPHGKIWPLLMIILGLVLGVVGFIILFVWFYKKDFFTSLHKFFNSIFIRKSHPPIPPPRKYNKPSHTSNSKHHIQPPDLLIPKPSMIV